MSESEVSRRINERIQRSVEGERKIFAEGGTIRTIISAGTAVVTLLMILLLVFYDGAAGGALRYALLACLMVVWGSALFAYFINNKNDTTMVSSLRKARQADLDVYEALIAAREEVLTLKRVVNEQEKELELLRLLKEQLTQRNSKAS